ncbi:MAG TPA: hypothetical protein VGI83_07940 [Gemmatimonadales bacterium]
MIAALLATGCADPKPMVSFSHEDPGVVRPYATLKAGRDTGTKGWPGTEVHVALAPALADADQRATLQHIIDSVVAKDTAIYWLRVTGFTARKPEPGDRDVPLFPVLQAIWAPPDTSDPGSRSHKAAHRIFYTSIPLPPDSSKR